MNEINKNEAQVKKSNILLEMGMILYQKIRNKEIEDESFSELSKELVRLDKIIYDESVEIEKLEEEKRGIFCECGNVANKKDKFCAECGANLQHEEYEEFKICELCETKIDLDSNYCVCCGNKIC